MKIKKSDLIILISIIISLISFFEIKYFSYKSEPLLLDYSSNKISFIINQIINDSLKNKIFNYKYNNIIVVERDKYDNISSIDFNNEIINNILYIITDEILDDIKLLEINNEGISYKYLSKDNKVYSIPYGIVFDNNILSNLGPKIPFKTSLVGSTNNDVKINIEEYGINSSKIEVVLNICFKMQIILPFKTNIIDIDKVILLDSKIIQGKVPNYYGGMFSVN